MSKPALTISIALLFAACSGSASDTTSTSVETTTTSATGTTVPDLSAELDSALARIEELEDQVETLESDLDQTRQEKEDAQAALTDAETEIKELLLAYDDEIQQLLAEGIIAVVETSCSAVDGALTDSQVAQLLDQQIAKWASQPGLPEGAEDSLDRQAIEEQVAICVADAAEQARLAELKAPKGDGFFTVGEEIAPGTWESQGSGEDCYWARLDSNQEIIDNHFGNAGGRVTIRSSDAEVEFSDCGTWEYQD